MDKERKNQKKQNIVIEVQTKQSHYNENKTEHYSAQKEQQDIKSEKCIKSDKYIETGVQVRILSKMVPFPMWRNIKRERNARVPRGNALYLWKGQDKPLRQNLGK